MRNTVHRRKRGLNSRRRTNNRRRTNSRSRKSSQFRRQRRSRRILHGGVIEKTYTELMNTIISLPTYQQKLDYFTGKSELNNYFDYTNPALQVIFNPGEKNTITEMVAKYKKADEWINSIHKQIESRYNSIIKSDGKEPEKYIKDIKNTHTGTNEILNYKMEKMDDLIATLSEMKKLKDIINPTEGKSNTNNKIQEIMKNMKDLMTKFTGRIAFVNDYINGTQLFITENENNNYVHIDTTQTHNEQRVTDEVVNSLFSQDKNIDYTTPQNVYQMMRVNSNAARLFEKIQSDIDILQLFLDSGIDTVIKNKEKLIRDEQAMIESIIKVHENPVDVDDENIFNLDWL
jgi:hypothetical protein